MKTVDEINSANPYFLKFILDFITALYLNLHFKGVIRSYYNYLFVNYLILVFTKRVVPLEMVEIAIRFCLV